MIFDMVAYELPNRSIFTRENESIPPMTQPHPWIAKRTLSFDSSGIRKVFALAAKLSNPINLSIGQPDFDVPQPIRFSAIEAIESGKNAYSPTQGVQPLLEKLQKTVDLQFAHKDRKVFVSSGTSGGLVLAMLSLIDPGDEVIVFDPYFVMYVPLIQLVGGKPVLIDTYPDFKVNVDKVRDAMTDRTKLVIFNSPGNPTGVTASVEEIEALAKLCKEKNVALISDEIYSRFHFDAPMRSPAEFNENTIVIDGFSKSHAMTGWRLGWVHGPEVVMQTMQKIQQYSFVCAPTPFQWGALAAMDFDMTKHYRDYAQKRDRIVKGLSTFYDFVVPGGAFYIFPKAPGGNATQFVEKCIERELLVIPGNIFSQRDTHFRISFAASDETLDRGIKVLRQLAVEMR